MAGISRRSFVKGSGTVVIGGVMLSAVPSLLAKAQRRPLGIQLYTVRDLMAKDLDGTLRDVAKAGYQEVESAGYFGRTAPQFRSAIESAGMRCVSAHHSLADLLAKQDELIEYVHDLGAQYLICAAPRAKDPSSKELTMDDWKWNFEQFNKIGEKTKTAGIQFGYHNHVGEFKKLDGVLVYDELLRQTDPGLVTMEMDCGWVVVAGFQPVEYLTKYPGRYTLLHVKDVVSKDGGPTRSTELGRGSVDYAPIFAAAERVQHYFYEQEEFDIPAVQAITVSADYLKKHGT